ncbi:ankyrin repeat domain-containing protein [Candidatus Phycorickettsia trachydisci]|nr:ankyrin repeat domain-containing protein [Candidatus Phycorickettsia trachydisci]
MILKRLLIIGNNLLPENSDQFKQIEKFYSTPDSLIIRHMDQDKWISLMGKIDSTTRIDIHAHGSDKLGLSELPSDKVYGLSLGEDGLCYRFKDIFSFLNILSKKSPLHIHIWSCFSGNAHKEITSLPKDSILFTHVSEDLESRGMLCHLAFSKSIEKWTNYDTSTSNKSIRAITLQAFLDNLAFEIFEGAGISTWNYESVYFFWKQQKVTEYEFHCTEDTFQNPEEVLVRENKKFNEFCNKILLNGETLAPTQFTKDQEKILQHGYLIKNLTDKSQETVNFLKEEDLPLSFFDENITYIDYYEGACIEQNIELIRYFLDKSWNLNQFNNSNGFTPLALIINNNKIKLLFEQQGIQSSLTQEAFEKQESIVKLLLGKGANPNLPGKDGISPLMLAIDQPNQSLVKLLLENGADATETFKHTIVSGTPEQIDLLLSLGADPNQIINNGLSALYYCVLSRKEIISLLMKYKPNFNDPLNAAAFETSVRAKDLDTVKLLLQHKIPDSLNVKALKAAVWGKDLGMVKLLLADSTDLDHLNSAMSLAIYDQNFKMVKLLADHGANVEKGLKSAKSLSESNELNQIIEFLESKLESDPLSLIDHANHDMTQIGEIELNDSTDNQHNI